MDKLLFLNVTESVINITGLSRVSFAVYQSLIIDGRQNGNHLAEKLGVDRTTVYRALTELERNGLIASTGEKYNCQFFVEDTGKLLNLAERKISESEKDFLALKKFVNEIPFLSLNQVLNSKVRVYRGVDSVKKVYQEKNRSGDAVLREISNNKVFPKIERGFWDKEIAMRIAKKSFLHQLVDSSDDSIEYHRTSPIQFKEVRVFPSDFVMSAGINIYKNSVAFHNSSIADPLAIIIEDRAMAELMKSFFDFVWNRSEVI